MTWVRIDDGAMTHPKLIDAGPDGVALWLSGLCHANRNHTDGRIESRHLGALYPGAWTTKRLMEVARTLVRVRLWEEVEGGYQIHDYAHYQAEATREEQEIRREYERTRKAQQRAAKGKAPGLSRTSPGQSPGQSRGHVPPPVPGVSAEGVPAPRPVPSRPVPSRPVQSPPNPPLGGSEVAGATGQTPEGPQEGAPKAPAKRWVTREEFAAARPPRGSLEAMAENLGYGLKGV